jgi:GGDEF domain-containing protein
MGTEPQQIFNVYRFEPGRDRHQLIGAVLEHEGSLDVLSDYFGYLQQLQGPRGQAIWKAMGRNPYFQVVSREQLRQGLYPKLLDQEPVPDNEPPIGKPGAVWEYTHPLLGPGPQVLEWKDGCGYLNGEGLQLSQVYQLLEYLRRGEAQIRYRRSPLEKTQAKFQELEKVEPHLADALGKLRDAVRQGSVHPDVLKALSQEIFVDPMVQGVGNKKAFQDFLTRPRAGVHVRMDGNDFGSINKIHSFEHGDHAIKAMGAAMRDAMDKTVGRGKGKLFRIGGDEFHAHVPDHAGAAAFARALRENLEAIPPVGGTHNLSVSMGFGPDADTADQASIQAKGAKKAQQYPIGQARTHVHSLMPGNEGAIPLDAEVPKLTPAPTVSPAALPAEPDEHSSGTGAGAPKS